MPIETPPSLTVTDPVGTADPSLAETETVNVTTPAYGAEAAAEVTVVVVIALTTSAVAADWLLANSAPSMKRAVIWCVPGRSEAVDQSHRARVALIVASVQEPISVSPSKKRAVPTGVAVVASTVAVKVTVERATTGFGTVPSVVVVATATIVWVSGLEVDVV